ncbi:MAG: stage II sporulation protein M [Chromatiales bacterium]|nr:stage II sporulation protein M [Chromatiales bacterium]
MKQEAFEQRYQALWDELSTQLDAMEKSRFKRRNLTLQHERLPHLYRQVCNHYALARGRRYSPTLVEQLHQLVLRGHQQLYTRRGAWLWRLLTFIAVDFPSSLRTHLSYFLVATLLFLVPAVLVGGFAMVDSDLIYSVISEGQVEDMEEMYRPDNDRPGRTLERSAESDFMMFGYYIMNNIGIGFRTFAMGILAGIGTVFTLIYNGVVLGGVAGHLTSVGYTETFWSFVSGHSSLELTAIVICGAAGLMLGHGVLAPGRYRRIDAIKQRAKQALPLVMGAGLMLFIAAFIEGFWSASAMPNVVKYAVGIALWVLMILYFIFAGRGADGTR